MIAAVEVPAARPGCCWPDCSGWWPIRWSSCCSRACASRPDGRCATCDCSSSAPPSGGRSGAACGSPSRACSWRRRSEFRWRSCSPATICPAVACSPGWWPCRRCCRRWSACSPSCSSTARPASSRCWCSGSSASTDPPWRLQGAGAILLVHAYSMYVYFYLFVRAALAVARRVALRGRGEPGRGAVAHAAHGHPAAAVPRARRRGAAHVHDGARLVQRAVHLRGRIPRDADADRRDPAQWRRPAGDGGNDRPHRAGAGRALALPRRAPGGWRGRRPEGRRPGAARGPEPAAAARARGRRLGAGHGAAAAAPDAAPGLVRPGRHLDHRAAAARPTRSGTTSRWCRIRCGRGRSPTASGWPTVATVAAVAIGLAWRPGERAARWPAVGRAIEALLSLPWAVPGTVFAIALATAFSVHAPWAGRVVLVGTVWILPLAYLVRNLPITSRAILAGVRALDPSLDEAAATLGAAPGAHPAPHHAAAAPAGAPGRGESRVRHRVRRLRDLDHALHLRHAAGLARDPLEPAPGGRRRGGGLRRRADARERRRLRASGADRGSAG